MNSRTPKDDSTSARDAGDPLEAALGEEPAAVGARVLERARGWVELETPSGDAERASALAVEVGDALREHRAEVELLDSPRWGRHVLGRVTGREPDAAPLLVLGHLDTVHPVGTLRDRPFRVEDGRAYGPGIFDMKAPLAVLAESLGLAARAGGPRRPLRVLVTCDEEVGSPSSRERIEAEADDAAAVLVLEPPLPGGRAKTARKGVAHYELHVTGVATHAGLDPERGVSAIEELARQILRIADLADSGRGTTLNVGVVGGGTAGNVIAEHASAEVEVRYLEAGEGRRVDRALRRLEPYASGARLHLDGGENRPPLERTDDIVRLYRRARELAAALGFDIGEGTAGGASDGSFTAALGVPTLDGLGVDGDGAHGAHEHIVVADLPRRVALVHGLIMTL